jgi:hypothetical protein
MYPMFARPNSSHSQVAYVTNDIEAAAALLERQFDAPGFFIFSNVQPGMEQSGGAQLRIGLARVGGVEIELIEPIGDTAPLFSDVLTGGEGLKLRFHHICARIDGPIGNWEAHAASIDTDAHPIVYSGELGDDLRFFYTDERTTLGHYLEHVWMSPALLAQVAAATPTYPAS